MNSIPEFDQLAEMAATSPEVFEQLRQEAIQKALDDSNHSAERRLQGLQFKIEMERRRAVSPMAACVRISKMMHESLEELTGLLRQETQHSYCDPAPKRADVISITRRQDT